MIADHNILEFKIFKNISAKTQQELTKHAKNKYYKKSTILAPNNHPDCHFYYIVTGHVKLFQETAGGDEIVINILSAGNFSGEHILFDLDFEPFQVQAINDLELIVWPINLLAKLMQQDQQLFINLLQNTLAKQNELIMELEHQHTQTVEQRLGCLLLKLCNKKSNRDKEIILKLPFNKSILAARLGMRPETFSRALHKLCENFNLVNKGNILYIKSIEPLIDEMSRNCSDHHISKRFDF